MNTLFRKLTVTVISIVAVAILVERRQVVVDSQPAPGIIGSSFCAAMNSIYPQ